VGIGADVVRAKRRVVERRRLVSEKKLGAILSLLGVDRGYFSDLEER
jgi:hypothetical protein